MTGFLRNFPVLAVPLNLGELGRGAVLEPGHGAAEAYETAKPVRGRS
ncbi:hypothetical protein ABZ915_46850 [Streptomyces sp. NPDC046915]